MFSSRIIRGGVHEARPILLEELGGSALPDAGGFVPLPLGGGLPAAQEPDLAAAAVPLPMEIPAEPSIPESEALARVEAAYEEGLLEGKREAEAELASVSEALAEALLSVEGLRRTLFHQAEDDLLKLAMLVARKIIVREISEEPAVLAGMVQGALELVTECDEVVVRLHPEDHAVVAASSAFAQLSSEKRRIVLKADPAFERGGCMLETLRGNVDARLESQLDEIYRRLTDERSSRRDEESDAD